MDKNTFFFKTASKKLSAGLKCLLIQAMFFAHFQADENFFSTKTIFSWEEPHFFFFPSQKTNNKKAAILWARKENTQLKGVKKTTDGDNIRHKGKIHASEFVERHMFPIKMWFTS